MTTFPLALTLYKEFPLDLQEKILSDLKNKGDITLEKLAGIHTFLTIIKNYGINSENLLTMSSETSFAPLLFYRGDFEESFTNEEWFFLDVDYNFYNVITPENNGFHEVKEFLDFCNAREKVLNHENTQSCIQWKRFQRLIEIKNSYRVGIFVNSGTSDGGRVVHETLTESQLKNQMDTDIEKITFIIKINKPHDGMTLYTSEVREKPEIYIGNYQSLPKMYGEDPLNYFDIFVIHEMFRNGSFF